MSSLARLLAVLLGAAVLGLGCAPSPSRPGGRGGSDEEGGASGSGTAGSGAPTGGTGGKPSGGGGSGGTVMPDAGSGSGGRADAAPTASPDARTPDARATGGSGGTPAMGEPAVQMFDSPCLGVPDPDVAAGPTLVGTAIQWTAYFFKPDGTMDHSYKWKALRGNLISDTHIVYDSPTKHWFMTTIVGLGGGTYGVQFMVSTDENARDWKLSIPIEMPRLIDDPQPTVTSDKVVITESGKCVWAVDKMALIAGDAPAVKALTCTVAQNNQVAAVKFGPQPPANGYAITMADKSTINWLSVEGPPASAKVSEHRLTVPQLDEVPLAGITQAGRGGLESGQVKAMWHGGHIVWSKTFRCNGVSCIRHYNVDTTANSVTATDYAMADTQLFYGGVGLDQGGNTWILSAATKKDGFVGLALSGRSVTGSVFGPKQIVEGKSAIPGSGGLIRFGDYFSAAMDPTDGSTWLIGQYASVKSALNSENVTGCKVVKVTAR
jgi:hypothetical protein